MKCYDTWWDEQENRRRAVHSPRGSSRVWFVCATSAKGKEQPSPLRGFGKDVYDWEAHASALLWSKLIHWSTFDEQTQRDKGTTKWIGGKGTILLLTHVA